MEATEDQAETPAPQRVAHDVKIGPTQTFDAKGVVRQVWMLECSCGAKGRAIDQSGIEREARLHGLEMQVRELSAMVGTAFIALEGMSAAMQAAGIVPPGEPDAPMPEPPTEPAG